MEKKPPQSERNLRAQSPVFGSLFAVVEPPQADPYIKSPALTDDIIFIRLPAVKSMTGLSKTTLYSLIRNGNFPAPVALGERVVAWIRSEVVQWAANRILSSRAGVRGSRESKVLRSLSPELRGARKSA